MWHAVCEEIVMNTAPMNQRLVQYSPEMESADAFSDGQVRTAQRRFVANAETLDEGLVMEFAAELLDARTAEIFNGTLSRLMARARQAASRPLAPAVAQALQDKLLNIAQGVLPFAGRALGLPRGKAGASVPAGAVVNSGQGPTIASGARAFGLELEGLSPEDKEFELAKAFVRLASDAVGHAAGTTGSTSSPQHLASSAVAEAARRWAPGLARPGQGHPPSLSTHRKEPTMHDTDRTQLEYSNEQFEFGENEWSPEGTFNENEEAELAAELLSVSNEGELDRFLGDLVSRATQAVGSFVRSPAGQAVGGVLKGVAKKALPMAGTAIGSYFGGPLGAKIGAGVANAASSALGLESEMTGEDRELEGAKQFVRIAGQTAATAAAAPPGANPRAVAQQAALTAAMQHAPGLLSGNAAAASGSPQNGADGGGRSGRWLRRGNKIVLYGA